MPVPDDIIPPRMTDEPMKRVDEIMTEDTQDMMASQIAVLMSDDYHKMTADKLEQMVKATIHNLQAALAACQQREAAAQEEIKRLRGQLSMKEKHHKLDRERLRKAREVLDKIAAHDYAGAGTLAKKGLENEG